VLCFASVIATDDEVGLLNEQIIAPTLRLVAALVSRGGISQEQLGGSIVSANSLALLHVVEPIVATNL